MVWMPGPDLDTYDDVDCTPPSNHTPGPPVIRSPAAPDPLTQAERARMFDAANKALRVWSGPVGELVSREIKVFLEMGYRFGSHAFIHALVEQVMKAEKP